MTNSDLRTNEAIQGIYRKLKDSNDIDWEQRRYEISKEIMYYCAESSRMLLLKGEGLGEAYSGMSFAQAVSKQAVMFADALIEELKKKD